MPRMWIEPMSAFTPSSVGFSYAVWACWPAAHAEVNRAAATAIPMPRLRFGFTSSPSCRRIESQPSERAGTVPCGPDSLANAGLYACRWRLANRLAAAQGTVLRVTLVLAKGAPQHDIQGRRDRRLPAPRRRTYRGNRRATPQG